MKLLTTVCLFWMSIQATAQTPQLIFNSGFEPNTFNTGQGSLSSDLGGIDLSVPPPNNWDSLDNHPNIGDFDLQYEGGDSTQRLAEIVADPTDPLNSVMEFWIVEPNVIVDSVTKKSRVQANLYNNTGITNLAYSIRMYLPRDLDTFKYAPFELTWFTLMEFWNNPGFIDPVHGFRIGVNMMKLGNGPDSLRLGVHGEIYNQVTEKYDSLWHELNTDFDLPTGKWITLDVNFIEGDDQNGRFYMAATPEGEPQTVVYDITNWTHHPNDSTPDGLSHVNPFKLYTSDGLVDTMTANGLLTHVYWDDFKVWLDSTMTTGISTLDFTSEQLFLYPHPADDVLNVRLPQGNEQRRSVQIYDLTGRTIRTKDVPKGNTTFQINTSGIPDGQYVIRVMDGNRMLSQPLLILH